MPDPYVQGPLVMQTPAAAALAEVLVKAAERLYDAATEEETAPMWETGREIASWVLAVCHRAEGDTVTRRKREQRTINQPIPPIETSKQHAGQFIMPGIELAQPASDPG